MGWPRAAIARDTGHLGVPWGLFYLEGKAAPRHPGSRSSITSLSPPWALPSRGVTVAVARRGGHMGRGGLGARPGGAGRNGGIRGAHP